MFLEDGFRKPSSYCIRGEQNQCVTRGAHRMQVCIFCQRMGRRYHEFKCVIVQHR